MKSTYVNNKTYKYHIRWCGFYFTISENIIEGVVAVPMNDCSVKCSPIASRSSWAQAHKKCMNAQAFGVEVDRNR